MLKIYIILGSFWIALFSCSTPKRLNKVMNKLPEAAAKECAARFPIKETIDTVIVVDSATLQAYEMEFVYLYSMLDSLLGHQVSDSVKREIVTVFQEKKVPVIKYKYITRTVENTAKYQVLIDSCQNLTSQNMAKIDKISKEKELYLTQYINEKAKAEKYKKQRNINFWWIVLLLVFIFRKPILKIITKHIKR